MLWLNFFKAKYAMVFQKKPPSAWYWQSFQGNSFDALFTTTVTCLHNCYIPRQNGSYLGIYASIKATIGVLTISLKG